MLGREGGRPETVSFSRFCSIDIGKGRIGPICLYGWCGNPGTSRRFFGRRLGCFLRVYRRGGRFYGEGAKWSLLGLPDRDKSGRELSPPCATKPLPARMESPHWTAGWPTGRDDGDEGEDDGSRRDRATGRHPIALHAIVCVREGEAHR